MEKIHQFAQTLIVLQYIQEKLNIEETDKEKKPISLQTEQQILT